MSAVSVPRPSFVRRHRRRRPARGALVRSTSLPLLACAWACTGESGTAAVPPEGEGSSAAALATAAVPPGTTVAPSGALDPDLVNPDLGGGLVFDPGSFIGPGISWASFTAPNPTDGDALRVRDILLNANRYALTTWYDSVKNYDSQTGTHLSFGGNGEENIRPAASQALALAVSLKVGLYDSGVTGVARATAVARTLRLVRSLAHRHRINSAGGWGYDWQTPLWTLYAGTAGWLMWEQLGATAAEEVRRMVEAEGRRLVGYRVPYYRSDSGAVISDGDSKSEENAWNAQFLYLAVNMMPGHPLRAAWEYKAAELAVSAHARPSDLTSNNAVVGGRAVKHWLEGSNLNSDGTVINHKIVHPDYMATAAYSAAAPIWYGLRRKPTPSTMFVRAADVYETLVELEWDPSASTPGTSCIFSPCTCDWDFDCNVTSPGGTIYVDRSSTIYFPNGTDWGTGRRMNYALLDVVARHFDLDGLVGVGEKARDWEVLHAQAALEMQLRSADRRTYVTSGEDTYPGREEWVAVHAALAYLVKWIAAQGVYSRSSAFIPVVLDNQDRQFNVTGPWENDDPADGLGFSNLYHEGGGPGGSRRAQWRPKHLPAGLYRVWAWWSAFPNHATDVPYSVFHQGGVSTIRVNQRINGNRWNNLGNFTFDGTSATGYVEMWNRTSTGYVVADGVMFQKL